MALLDADGKLLHARLWRLTQRADVAEELMQDLVIKLAASDSFAQADRPLAFALRSATNLALDWRRKQVRRGPVASWSDGAEVAGEPDEPSARLERDEELTQLLDALAQMKPTDRVVLTMRYLEDADYDMVGQAIGKTADQARGLCSKAVGRLRKHIDKQTPAEAKS
ncbi:MAG: sigma-70 family RNA polymerase sigma factor [Planctomycetota bacterium]